MIPLPLAFALTYGPIESGAPIVGAPRGVEDLGDLRATTYAPGDGQSGDDVGCPAEAERGPGTRAFAALALAGVPVVAHRSLPCGTWLLLCGPAGCALGVVLDRGPYGLDCLGATEAARGAPPPRAMQRRSRTAVTRGGRAPVQSLPGIYRVAAHEEAWRAHREPAWAPRGCVWRGDLDLVPAVAETIGLSGAGTQRRGEVRAWRMTP